MKVIRSILKENNLLPAELVVPFGRPEGIKSGFGQYLVRINSVPNSVRGTPVRG